MEQCGAELEWRGKDQRAHGGWQESIFGHFSLYIWESWQHEVFFLLALSPFT